ncbi:hypothetical protein FKP32DRAFT_497580 [Trametes sanguinea]|nr:hypothetical protein FKP32DRAFT_497580 [Trametes sanguinea]
MHGSPANLLPYVGPSRRMLGHALGMGPPYAALHPVCTSSPSLLCAIRGFRLSSSRARGRAGGVRRAGVLGRSCVSCLWSARTGERMGRLLAPGWRPGIAVACSFEGREDTLARSRRRGRGECGVLLYLIAALICSASWCRPEIWWCGRICMRGCGGERRAGGEPVSLHEHGLALEPTATWCVLRRTSHHLRSLTIAANVAVFHTDAPVFPVFSSIATKRSRCCTQHGDEHGMECTHLIYNHCMPFHYLISTVRAVSDQPSCLVQC